MTHTVMVKEDVAGLDLETVTKTSTYCILALGPFDISACHIPTISSPCAACGGDIGCSAPLDGAGTSEEVGGAEVDVEEGGGGLCCDELAGAAPAEATASGGWYCCVACTPSRSGIDDSWRRERFTIGEYKK